MKKIISIILTICMLTTIIPSFANAQSAQNDTTDISSDYAQTIVKTAAELVKLNYKFDVTTEELYKNALMQILKEHPEVWESAFRGIFDNLDDHSTYFTKEEYEKFYENLSGEFSGIGVGIMEFEEGLYVTKVYKNSPAEKVGMKSGDLIIKANGVSIIGMQFEEAKTHIVGPIGSEVIIGFIRDGVYIEKSMLRDNVIIESGEYKTLENNTIGYIQLYNFDEHASSFMTEALTNFANYNIKNLIIDLRNNPGGSLTALVDVCQNFIPQGPIIHIDYKNPLNSFTLTSENKNPKYNIIVLVNENSASASEAFSGAVQDTGVGIVVGSQTYGKGTMQNVTKFKVGGGIKLTEAVYLTPNRRNINGKGIEPDVKVKDKEIKYVDADLLPITYNKVLKIGDSGDDVKAIKQRLKLLGLSVNDDSDVYDTEMYLATKKFQELQGLYPYGVMDITTQVALENVFMPSTISDNKVFNTAVEIFRTGTFESYKSEWPGPDTK